MQLPLSLIASCNFLFLFCAFFAHCIDEPRPNYCRILEHQYVIVLATKGSTIYSVETLKAG